MTQVLLVANLIFFIIAVIAVVAARGLGRRAGKYKTEAESIRAALVTVKEKAERLQKLIGETAKVEEEADAERKNLERTPDTGLAGRANSLFMQNSGAGNNPRGNAGGVAAAPSGPAGNGSGAV